MKRLAFALLAGSLLLPSCVMSWGNDFQVERNAQYDFGTNNVREVEVHSRNGQIRVEAGGTEVACQARYRASASSEELAWDLLDDVDLDWSVDDDVLVLKVHVPYTRSNWGADLQLTIPQRMALKLVTSNGPITVADEFSDVRADTSNGPITVHCRGGAATLETSNGPVSLVGLPQEFEVHTSNGNVSVSLEQSWAGNGSVRTSNGGIKVSCKGTIDAELDARTSNAKVRVTGPELLEGSGRLKLRSSNGGIRIEHGRGPAPSG